MFENLSLIMINRQGCIILGLLKVCSSKNELWKRCKDGWRLWSMCKICYSPFLRFFLQWCLIVTDQNYQIMIVYIFMWYISFQDVWISEYIAIATKPCTMIQKKKLKTKIDFLSSFGFASDVLKIKMAWKNWQLFVFCILVVVADVIIIIGLYVLYHQLFFLKRWQSLPMCMYLLSVADKSHS
jgi:hypothetical protein